jgi:hypothetical protein
MNESIDDHNKSHAPRPAKPLRSERMAARGVDLKKKHVRAGAVAAGGLLALVGLAAMLLGS